MFLFVEAVLVAKAAGASSSSCYREEISLFPPLSLPPSILSTLTFPSSLPLLSPSLLIHAQLSERREDIKCSAPHRGAAQPSAAAAAAAAVSAALPGDY